MLTQERGSAQGATKAAKETGKYKLRPEVARPMMARNLAGKIGYVKLSDLSDPKHPILLDRLLTSKLVGLSLKPGERVYPRLGHDLTLMVLTQGSLNVILDNEPDRLLIKRLEPDAIFGEMPLLGTGLFGAVIEAATAAHVTVINEAGVERIIVRWPRFLRAWTRLTGPTHFESDRLSVVSTYGSRHSRVIYELLLLARDRPLIQTTHQDLADKLGTDRASVSRVLAQLEGEGIISIHRGSIEIKDLKRLSDLALF